MNHIYRSIWNFALGCWVAVPETAKHGGQPTSSSQTASPSWVPDEAQCLQQKKTFKPLAVAVAVSLVLQTVITPYALAQTYFYYEGGLAFGNNTAYSAAPIVPPSSTSIWDLGADNLGVGVVTQNTGPNAYGLLAVGSGAVLKAPSIFIGHANKGAFPPDSNRVASGSLIILGALEAMNVEVGVDGGSGVFVVHEGGYANLTMLQLGVGGDAVGTISGTGSVPATNGGWTLKTQQATVGTTSIGNLTIDDGARVLTEQELVVGQGQLGKGYVTVRGKNTYYEAGTVILGRQAGDLGRLQILSGAGMKVLEQFKGGESGNSEVLVTGAGSLLDIAADMQLGGDTYTSTVRIEQAGALKVQGAINTSSAGVSEITVTGNNATLSATSIALGDDSLGAGNGTSSLTVDNNGLVQTSTVTLGKSAGSTGNLILNGNAQGRGVLEANQILKGGGTANLEVNGGVLRAASSSADLLAQFPSFTFGAEGMGLDTNGHNLTVNTNFAGAATAGAVGLIESTRVL